jgi:pentatricopeptide repeat protein
VKAGCHLEALDAYKEMIEAGCKPNIFTMTVLIHSLTETGKLDGACELFAKLKSIQCRPSHVTYSLLIRAHAKAGSLEKAMFFYKSMVEAGMALPPAVRNLLLTALREGGKEVEAQQLMAELETSSTTSPSASVGQQPKKSKARSGSSVPLKVGLPKPEKLAALICKWNTDTAKALEVVKLKLRHPYVLNVLTLLSKEPDAAWWFFEWLRAQEGYKHTKYAYTKMLDIIAKHQNIELLRTVLSEVEREGKANTVAYNTLIQCYSQNKHMDAALQVGLFHFPPNPTFIVNVLENRLKFLAKSFFSFHVFSCAFVSVLSNLQVVLGGETGTWVLNQITWAGGKPQLGLHQGPALGCLRNMLT